MSLHYHEIAESRHRILNPFTEEKLDLLGRICRLENGWSHLDLCCGKGEMLSQWARQYGIRGVGVDLSEVFLAAARERADELGVTERVDFILSDANSFLEGNSGRFDVVSCIGATWIGDGLAGTITKSAPALADDGLMLMGETYWIQEPTPEVCTALGVTAAGIAPLADFPDVVESTGFELIEMVLADPGSWDRYCAAQWWPVSDWLAANPADSEAPEIRDLLDRSRRSHLLARAYLGWGVFVLRRRR